MPDIPWIRAVAKAGPVWLVIVVWAGLGGRDRSVVQKLAAERFGKISLDVRERGLLILHEGWRVGGM